MAAEEPQKPAAPEVAVSDVPKAEQTTTERDAPAAPEPAPESAEMKPADGETVAEEPEKPAAPVEDPDTITQVSSFQEETNVVSELPEVQRKALEELKKLVQEALNNHDFTSPPAKEVPEKKTEEEHESKEAAAETAAAAAEEKKESDSDAVSVVADAPFVAAEAKGEPAKTEAPAETPQTEETKKDDKSEMAADTPGVVAENKTTITEYDTSKPVEEKIISECPTEEAPKVDSSESKGSAPSEPEETPKDASEPCPVTSKPEQVFLWGLPILGDERSDTILLKFLRARDFKVKEALTMIKKCVCWRREFDVESVLEEDLGNEYEKVVFTHGIDKEGRVVVYNVFGEFQDKELYQMTFGDSKKQEKFLRWLIQFLEKTVRKLDFSPTGICSFVLVNDLKNSPGYGKREFYKVIDKFLQLLQDNYPEFVSKQVCINVSWWYLAYSWVYISVFTPRSRSKFVFAGSSKTTETLFKYVSPQHVPVQYGGHSRTGELEFSPDDPVTEVTLKPGSKHPIELVSNEQCTLVWELRVVGWDVNYEAQYVPTEGYTVLVSKPKKMNPSDDPLICDSFKISEPGKLIVTVDNQSSKKKKLLYRSKVKSSSSE